MKIRRRRAQKEEPQTVDSGEFFLSISDLMSALLLTVSALLVIALVNVSRNQAKLDQTHAKFAKLQKQINRLLQQRGVIIRQIRELEKRWQSLGINVQISPTTGDIIIKDEGLFFRSNQYKLEKKGKSFLRRFARSYFAIILSKEFRNNIQRILIIGHASREGNKRRNMKLSLQRSEAVAEYLSKHAFSGNSKQEQEYRRHFEERLLIAGRGILDAKRSRRMKDRTVRFRLYFRGSALDINKLFKKSGLQFPSDKNKSLQ